MRRVLTAFVAMACLLAAVELTPAQQPMVASVGFRNQTNLPILVQGYTIINKTQRPGQILQLKKNGDVAFDANVPAGIRYITIYNANQPAVVLLRDFPVPIQKRDVFFDIMPSPNNPKVFVLVPGTMPTP
jgi:hypothetical protein